MLRSRVEHDLASRRTKVESDLKVQLSAAQEELVTLRAQIRASENERDTLGAQRADIDQHLANLRAQLEVFAVFSTPSAEIDDTGEDRRNRS